jgi:aminopeptidase N
MGFDVRIKKGVSQLVLHQNGLKIKRCGVSYEDAPSSVEECQGWEMKDEEQKVVFRFGQVLKVGEARFHLFWSVDIAELPHPQPGQKGWLGLHVKHEGPNDYHHITQFEPCNARQAYPCIDQPCTKMVAHLFLCCYFGSYSFSF